MGFVAFRGFGADDALATLASMGVRRMLTPLMVTVRLSSGVVGAVVAMVGLAPPARPGWVIAGSLGILLWSGLFALQMLRRGPSPLLTCADVLVVMLLLLAHPWLVPAEVRAVSAGTGWVDIIAGASVWIAQFGLRQPFGLAVGFLVAAAYAVGDGQVREAPLHLAVGAVLAAGLVTALRRSADTADAVLADAADRRHAAIVRAAVRSDERDHQRHLHDTVLATLTMVHTGGIASESTALRECAAADLAVIEGLRARPASADEPGRPMVRLDLMLRFGTVRPQLGGTPLDVSTDISPVELPADVATAMAQCVAEALTNVARHADTGEAHLAARAHDDGVSVTVSDNGVGFDITAVPPHRRGVRESIEGRMRSIGGSARVRSGSGTGTRVVLRWPDG
ncbi:sensor histidine kinase [Phytohabitans houttuyneae]|uniref:Histidine kinase/HSP90-like ATPase domain-containing protein n=1 Tax=Phytohabitans houttuyneae TaxID=1076126 RepID=A0A6V8KLT1_9ACTN|nr:ATP-binding protein [Phytohabitans houttuyneae]GFJ83371.1 hypothetical protein Phou_075510 [Phytohabitans houttuyneae]